MLFPDIDPKEWSEKHKIEIINRTCRECGETFDLDVPTVTFTAYGFTSSHTKCGEGHRGYTFVAKSGEVEDLLRAAIEVVSNKGKYSEQ